MKNLYLVDYWVPFPSSEYGGMVAVVAKDDDECHDVLLAWRDDVDSQYDKLIMERVVNSPCYALSEDLKSEVVESFTT